MFASFPAAGAHHHARSFARAAVASIGTVAAAAVFGLACGAAGRTVLVLGFYEVAGALAISASGVFCHHVCRARPGAGRWGVAAVAALAWLGVARATDAALFRWEQVQVVDRESPILTHEFAASGVGSPAEFVDLGLQAETGRTGVVAAALVQLRAGLVVLRSPGRERRASMPLPLHVALLVGGAAFVAVVVARALTVLARAPGCGECGRFLRRRRCGHVTAAEAVRLAQAWALGGRDAPNTSGSIHAAAGAPTVFEDACPVAGHTTHVGWAIVRRRGRGLTAQEPGEIARCDAISRGSGSHEAPRSPTVD
ncbi:MAG: hypothetical protein EXR79_05940 [Myxococcales bacterium]|nr:hypothetical protein [Myxococcales bacterium]